jgi:ribosomal protein S18 acetylase RimI-like enzyme
MDGDATDGTDGGRGMNGSSLGGGSMEQARSGPPRSLERLIDFKGADLHDLCDAAEASIVDGGGFGWLVPPPRETMESFWRGILLVPERDLFAARLDGTICGSAQLVRPTRNNEAGGRVGQLSTFFVAPWARGHGLAVALVEAVARAARDAGLEVLQLDVRETQTRAIQIYEQLGFVRWGHNPRYAFVEGRWMTGYYYYRDLAPTPGDGAQEGAAQG